ncbi:DUF4913 domain-containing protein [Nocardia neocaledoniensis]|uniref:DUF4913 domain-containing protein n=1 Tax=Nocardia neocaledoniensis TaxID=236511 RepID=UPI0024539DE6|nr:DUF4913 domain-containing protein [Nocardia neocaledoniensis]
MTTTETTTETTATEEALTAVASKVVPQLDLPELLETALLKAVNTQIGTEAKKIADGVVAEMLTPEVRAGMLETARHQTEVALNPVPAEEPVPEPEVAAGGAVEEEAEEERKLEYETVDAFVDQYVAVNYRREITGRNPTHRWCPQWFLHGEVKERMTALWVAFEHLRLGKTTEQSAFWLMHFDQHMDRILDANGPFKHCSVRDGHSEELGALPTQPMPADLAPSGYETHASGIIVPASTTGSRSKVRAVLEFP